MSFHLFDAVGKKMNKGDFVLAQNIILLESRMTKMEVDWSLLPKSDFKLNENVTI